MADRVQVMKLERPATGGTQFDESPGEINPNEDGLDARSVFLQDDSSADKDVELSRDASGNMTFKDQQKAATLTELVKVEEHKALRQLIHFIEDGPGDGFLSGAYREVLPAASPFPTSVIWWESAAKAKKIVEKTITRSGGGATLVAPTPIVWKVYDTDGTTVLATATDDIVYSGVFETSRTRTIS